MPNLHKYIFTAFFLFSAVVTNAVELKEIPIQTQLASGITTNYESVSFAYAGDLSDEFDNQPGIEEEKDVSMVRAGLYSALLPGLGEYYVGHRSKARVFFAIEAATWISFFSFHIYGNLKEDDFINYAAVHAGANLVGKTDEFHDWVGFYDDIDQFNSLGRVQDPDRPYLLDNSDNHWRWQSSAEQSTYRHLKNRSREAFRRRDFMVGLAVVTRIVSIVDAVRDAKRAQRKIDDNEFSLTSNISYRLEVNPFDYDKPLSLAIVKRF